MALSNNPLICAKSFNAQSNSLFIIPSDVIYNLAYTHLAFNIHCRCMLFFLFKYIICIFRSCKSFFLHICEYFVCRVSMNEGRRVHNIQHGTFKAEIVSVSMVMQERVRA